MLGQIPQFVDVVNIDTITHSILDRGLILCGGRVDIPPGAVARLPAPVFNRHWRKRWMKRAGAVQSEPTPEPIPEPWDKPYVEHPGGPVQFDAPDEHVSVTPDIPKPAKKKRVQRKKTATRTAAKKEVTK